MRTDPVERMVEDALKHAGIQYTEPHDERNQNLDFYLPALNIHIEVKRMYTYRIHAQMCRVDDIIVIQGNRAALMFYEMLNPTQKLNKKTS